MPKPMTQKSSRLNEIGVLAANKKPHLIKFGKKPHLKVYSFKVSLASSFDDPSLNLAQMDNEMKAIFSPNPSEVNVTRMNAEKIHGFESIDIEYQIEKDYYIFCTSHTFDYRLFGDFDADSCLFIYDSYKFAEDIHKCLISQIRLEDYAYRAVDYLDPIQPNSHKRLQIEFHKHIRYLYQNEYRHVFVPKSPAGLKEDLFLEIPSVDQYTELIHL